jgi:hypothetical protein
MDVAIPAVIILVMVQIVAVRRAAVLHDSQAVAGHAPAVTLFMIGYLCHLVVAFCMTIPALVIDGSAARCGSCWPCRCTHHALVLRTDRVVGGVNDLFCAATSRGLP